MRWRTSSVTCKAQCEVWMTKIRLLFKMGFVYHKAAFDPVIDLFRQDERYDVYFSLEEERLRSFFVNVRYRTTLSAEWERQGKRFRKVKRGCDIIIVGDTIRNAEEYGNALLCFLNHGTGIKNILYRNLARHPEDRYHIFVEGQYRVDQLRASGSLQRSAVHLV